ncbi:DNA gyrase inhibitor YacG [Arhodomonas sp. AD133]|uniref:DNA gyrase inhibitor YacG n=1 Tax=Arhodomonas sp. AD133 TaxID=3415009 RepID=UPI003EBEB60A
MTSYVRCPTCERTVEWSERSPHRPFCSERCRLIDLGAWVDGSHRIPGEPADVPETYDDDTEDGHE